MIGNIVPLTLVSLACVVFVKAVMTIDRMSRQTSPLIAWPWILLAASALWVFCAALTGDCLTWAVLALLISLVGVVLIERRSAAVTSDLKKA